MTRFLKEILLGRRHDRVLKMPVGATQVQQRVCDKTTTTSNLGIGLAKQGKKLLQIDADALCRKNSYPEFYKSSSLSENKKVKRKKLRLNGNVSTVTFNFKKEFYNPRIVYITFVMLLY